MQLIICKSNDKFTTILQHISVMDFINNLNYDTHKTITVYVCIAYIDMVQDSVIVLLLAIH